MKKKILKMIFIWFMKIIAVITIITCIILSFTSCISDYKAEKDTEIPCQVIKLSD